MAFPDTGSAFFNAGIQSSLKKRMTNDALYVMFNPLLPGMVKIGRSFHPEGRARTLSKSQPFNIQVCHTYDGYGFLEKLLHSKLKKRCVIGGAGREWFSISSDQAHQIISAAVLEYELQL